MTTYAVDIARTLHYMAFVPFGIGRDFIYTPHVGGYINNDETEWDNTTWADDINDKPTWTDILNNNDSGYIYAIQQDTLTNWYTVKAQAGAAEVASSLASDVASAGFVPTSRTVNGPALSSDITLNQDDVSDGSTNKAYTATEKTKLAGLSAQIQPDWNASSGLGVILNKPGIPKVYFGTTLKSAPIFYTASTTVASGVAVFQLTVDGLSTGTAIFPNGPNTDSLNSFVSDATASYQMAYALTNSNKTLTITANKLTTANILTGILGQATANGAVVRLQVWGS